MAHSPTARRFTFVLLDRFTMLPFAAALDALRLANKMAGARLYDWRLVGPDGGFATCSGVSIGGWCRAAAGPVGQCLQLNDGVAGGVQIRARDNRAMV